MIKTFHEAYQFVQEQKVCTVFGSKSSLKKLQVSLQIVRSNNPKLKNDFWLPMREVHLDLVREHE